MTLQEQPGTNELGYLSYLEVYNGDRDTIGTVFDLQIRARTTLEEEKDVWYNTTSIKIVYGEPPCPVTQDIVNNSPRANQLIKMSALKGESDSFDLVGVLTELKGLFKT